MAPPRVGHDAAACWDGKTKRGVRPRQAPFFTFQGAVGKGMLSTSDQRMACLGENFNISWAPDAMATAKIFTLAWENVDENIVRTQRDVFAKLGISISQHIIDEFQHADWLDWVMGYYSTDVYIFIDIDCIPLNAGIVQAAAQEALNGKLFGVAQSCNSKPIQDDHIYAGPSFMSISQAVYERIGKPSFRPTPSADAGETITYAWEGNRIPVTLLYPTEVIHLIWRLGTDRHFGIGTTYANSVFHLFEGRKPPYTALFLEKARQVLDA